MAGLDNLKAIVKMMATEGGLIIFLREKTMNAEQLAALLNTLTRYELETSYSGYGSYSYMEPNASGDYVRLEEVVTLLKLKMGEGENWNKIESA